MSSTLLLGLPSKVKSLLDRLTATRAANLDSIDTTVSSRAPASTALSNATWTNTKAGQIDASVSSRASQTSVNTVSSNVTSVLNNADVKTSTRLSSVTPQWQFDHVTNAEFTTAVGTGFEADSVYWDMAVTVSNLANSFVLLQGGYTNSAGSLLPTSARLINDTTVRVATSKLFSPTHLRVGIMVVRID